MRPIVFWGASGHAKVLRDCLIGHRLVAVFDNNPDCTPPFDDVPLFIGWDGFAKWRVSNATHAGNFGFAVAIGGNRGADRCEIHNQLVLAGLTPLTVSHRLSSSADDIRYGSGCQFLARSWVGAGAKLGDECIINTGAIVDHECVLESGVHIAPGAVLCGLVRVGCFSMVGAGATVLPRVSIGRFSTVGAGAVVTKDVPDGATVVGVPAREVRSTPKAR